MFVMEEVGDYFIREILAPANVPTGITAGLLKLVADTQDLRVRHDDMAGDSTADWTDTGASTALAFDTDHYEVTTSAANQNSWLKTASAMPIQLKAGRIYKIVMTIKNGTASAKNIQAYFNDGTAQYSASNATTASSVEHTDSFVAAADTDAGIVGFRVVDDLSGSNLEISEFEVYEVVNTKFYKGREARAAFITIDSGSNAANFTLDGSTPSSLAQPGGNGGHQLAAGDSLLLKGHANVKKFKCVDAVSGSAAIVKVSLAY